MSGRNNTKDGSFYMVRLVLG